MIAELYAIIAVALVALEQLYFWVADKYNIVDRPNERSSHKRVTIRGGGIVCLFGVWLYMLGFGLDYGWFLLGVTLIAAISFADDLRSVPNRYRIVVHFVAILLMFYELGILNATMWVWVLPAWIVCTGIINAYNFMDGINGITGAYSLAVLVPLLLLDRSMGFVDVNLIGVAILSVLIFCLYNFRTKARCFAGDVGAISIAFVVLFILGRLIVASGELWYLIFLAVYGVDTILTIIHRLLLRENIFKAHRKHLYQLLANELKMPHTLVAGIYALVQLAVSLGVIYLPINRGVYFFAVIAILVIVYILLKRRYYHLHEEYLKRCN